MAKRRASRDGRVTFSLSTRMRPDMRDKLFDLAEARGVPAAHVVGQMLEKGVVDAEREMVTAS